MRGEGGPDGVGCGDFEIVVGGCWVDEERRIEGTSERYMGWRRMYHST